MASQANSWEALRRHIPEPALLAAGGLGGPFVIFCTTPLRNAMSNGAQDQAAGLAQLYSKALGSPSLSLASRLKVGYTGAMVSVGPACPQWCMIGPAFHFLNGYMPTAAAVLATACVETFITYGSQSRNAQMAYNVQVPKAPVPLFNVIRPWGPGAPFYVLRNSCGMAGIRLLSPPFQNVLGPVLPRGPREIVADMLASICTCAVSGPLNVSWAYAVTSPKLWTMPLREQCTTLIAYLRSQYLDDSGKRLSRLAARDMGVRCIYISSCFTMFSSIERCAVAYWPK